VIVERIPDFFATPGSVLASIFIEASLLRDKGFPIDQEAK
jgi:hypothetical protein